MFPLRAASGEALSLAASAPLLARVVCVRSDAHLGKLCTLKVLAGSLAAGDAIAGPRSAEKGEKPGGLFRLVGKRRREPVESASAGEIVTLSRFEGASFGDLIVQLGARAPLLDPIVQPEPVVALALVPRSRNDEQKIGEALRKLAQEDPTFRFEHDADTHELLVHGLTEQHLAVAQARLARRFGVEVSAHPPRIAYRETVTRRAEGHHRHKKQTGGRGQFGECFVRVRPNPKGSGVTFTDAVVGGSIPRNLIPAVEKGVREAAAKGVLTHSQVVDVDLELYDGKFHDVDSDEASFKIAGARAFIDAFQKAAPVLLEPVMDVEVTVPTDSAGAIFSDLTSHRRAQVHDQSTSADGAFTTIRAHAPLSLLQSYQRDLKSMTAGEGCFSMHLSDYAPLPAQEQQRVLSSAARGEPLEV
jgi:elongation factor G